MPPQTDKDALAAARELLKPRLDAVKHLAELQRTQKLKSDAVEAAMADLADADRAFDAACRDARDAGWNGDELAQLGFVPTTQAGPVRGSGRGRRRKVSLDALRADASSEANPVGTHSAEIRGAGQHEPAVAVAS